MLETDEKLMVSEQMLKLHEVDLYRAEVNLKIADAVGRDDLAAQHTDLIQALQKAISVIKAEIQETAGQCEK